MQISNEAQAGEIVSFVPPLWRLVARNGGTIVPFSEEGNGLALYCVHSITGDVSSFNDLARALGKEQRFYGIQVPRNRMNADLAASIEEVARQHLQALVAFQKDGPIVLAGWSAGAIIALEMAQQLLAVGREVPLLIALDGAPCNTGAGMSRGSPLYVWKLFCNLPSWAKYQAIQNGSLKECIRKIAAKFAFRAQMALPSVKSDQTLHGSAVQGLLDRAGWLNEQKAFMRALYDAMRAYVPKPYTGRVVVYEARTQPLDHLLQVGAAWKKIAAESEIVLLDGNHEMLFKEPGIGVLARHLRMKLAELRRIRA
jgi:thioesterase domain-containing protein